MQHLPTIGLAAAGLITLSTATLAADNAPDIRGNWSGRTYTIVAGAGGHWPSNSGTMDKPGLHEKDLVMTITGQEGRRFWGVWTISGNGEKTEEQFIGELHGHGNRQVLVAGTNGYLNGELRGNGLSFCYANAGGKTNTSVVSCTEVKRVSH